MYKNICLFSKLFLFRSSEKEKEKEDFSLSLPGTNYEAGKGVLFGLVFLRGDSFPFRMTLRALSYASKWSRKSSGITGLRSALFMYAVLFGGFDAFVLFFTGGERFL